MVGNLTMDPATFDLVAHPANAAGDRHFAACAR